MRQPERVEAPGRLRPQVPRPWVVHVARALQWIDRRRRDEPVVGFGTHEPGGRCIGGGSSGLRHEPRDEADIHLPGIAVGQPDLGDLVEGQPLRAVVAEDDHAAATEPQ